MKKPNIVLILSDQHNASVMGCNGDHYIKTPNLDKLAANGTFFSNCYCASPLCVPSRSSFLTGQLPISTQVLNNHQSLHSGRATIAHAMVNAGYETVLSGRMHFSGDDQYHGYEQRLVGDLTPYYAGYDFMTDSMEDLYDAFLPGKPGFEKIGSGMTSIYHYDNDVVEATSDYLRERADERPLFLTVGLSAPHPPYICDKETYDYYYDLLPEVSEEEASDEHLHQALKDFAKLRKMDLIEKKDFRKIRAAYYGLVEFLDGNVGRIIDQVEASLGLDNTIVVYMSDHGDHIGSKNMIWKGSFLEDSAKVPMIVSYPDNYLSGEVVKDPVGLLDLTRTLVDMSDGEPLPSMDGTSLMPYLNTKDYEEKDRMVMAQIGSYPVTFVPSAMIRKGQYKMIKYHGYDTPSLYDLAKDPKELMDVGTDPTYAALVAELSEELSKKWNSDVAKEISSTTRDHYKIINQWSHKTSFVKKVNWTTKPGSNYLD